MANPQSNLPIVPRATSAGRAQGRSLAADCAVRRGAANVYALRKTLATVVGTERWAIQVRHNIRQPMHLAALNALDIDGTRSWAVILCESHALPSVLYNSARTTYPADSNAVRHTDSPAPCAAFVSIFQDSGESAAVSRPKPPAE